MEQDKNPEGARANAKGLAMYKMLFGKKSDKRLVGLCEFTINHLFANIWSRSRPPIDDERMISMRERSMITVALLAAQGRSGELAIHIRGARHLACRRNRSSRS